MTTIYVRRAVVIASAANAEIVNTAMANLGHGPSNLRAPLVPSDGADDAEATHLGCDAQFAEEDIAPYVAQSGALVSWCDVDYLTYMLRAANVEAMQESVGQVVRFDDLAAALGLKRRVVAMELT